MAQFGPFLPTGVFLGGVQFSTDPEPYEPLNWAKRASYHMTIGDVSSNGSLVIQDFGMVMKDNTLRLASGRERLLDESIMLNLYNKFLAKGTVYSFTDWLGNDFDVFIKSFVPVPFKRGAGKSGSGPDPLSLWTYTMELQVLTIRKIVGVTYTGS